MSVKPPTPDDSMRGMKLMVSAMGVVLIGGVLVLVYAGFRKIEQEGRDHTGLQKPVTSTCIKNTESISLPEGVVVQPLYLSDTHISATIRKPNGDYMVLTYNRCTGGLDSTFSFLKAPQ